MSDLSQRVRSVGVINVAAVIVSFAAGILAAVAAPQLGLPNDPWIVVGVVLAALIVLAIAIAFLRGTEGGERAFTRAYSWSPPYCSLALRWR